MFNTESPFTQTHGAKYSTKNAELLNYQLKNDYSASIDQLHNLSSSSTSTSTSSSSSTSTATSSSTSNHQITGNRVYQDPFNAQLQKRIDSGSTSVSLSTMPSLMSSNASTSPSDTEDETVLAKSQYEQPNYVTLKILVERSILETMDNDGTVLTLEEFEHVKSKIEEQNELKTYLKSKLSLTHQFIKAILDDRENSDNGASEIDASFLKRTLKISSSLQQNLDNVNDDLINLQKKLYQHIMSCWMLYVDNNDPFELAYKYGADNSSNINNISNSNSNSNSSNDNGNGNGSRSNLTNSLHSRATTKEVESIFAYIASVAAQHNITLPTPEPEQGSSSTAYLEQCINTLVLKAPATSSTTESSLSKNDQFFFTSVASSPTSIKSPIKSASEYKTAMNDLQFTIQFLTKELEMSKTSLSKLTQKLNRLESERNSSTTSTGKKIIGNNNNMNNNNNNNNNNSSSSSTTTTTTSTTTTQETSYPSNLSIDKDEEISRLRRELYTLKISTQPSPPNTSTSASTHLSATSPLFNYIAPSTNVSPVTGGSLGPAMEHSRQGSSDHELNVHNGNRDSFDSSRGTQAAAATTTTTTTTTAPPSSSSSSSGVANALLRKEFKKIVNEMQDQYELDLTAERMRRKKLEEELAQLRSNSL
ncbi:Ccoiled-coil polarisome protein [Lodderomyces elongisporus]|uniref:Ccoiled-coil polarisome protein n=1 Tax=Lodderomyces elongisporus TaxID=36914 RepID=UPI00292467C1|nr:Ccoiled-coil polarisome protein [Lodderomyces elongisporus]WLF77314.1 Ccoiled-coil polarisome protein [Lodderomyces elongisporus]